MGGGVVSDMDMVLAIPVSLFSPQLAEVDVFSVLHSHTK